MTHYTVPHEQLPYHLNAKNMLAESGVLILVLPINSPKSMSVVIAPDEGKGQQE